MLTLIIIIVVIWFLVSASKSQPSSSNTNTNTSYTYIPEKSSKKKPHKQLTHGSNIQQENPNNYKIFELVRTILVKLLDVDAKSITRDSEIMDDLGADSLDIVDMVMSLEEKFDIEIADEDIDSLRTVEDWVQYIEGKTVTKGTTPISRSSTTEKQTQSQNNRPYKNRCWNCQTPVNENMIRCRECGWYVCPRCKACSIGNFHEKDKAIIIAANNDVCQNGFYKYLTHFTKKSLQEFVHMKYPLWSGVSFGEYGCFEYVTLLLLLDYYQRSSDKIYEACCEVVEFVLSESYAGRLSPSCMSDFVDIIYEDFTDMDVTIRKEVYQYLKSEHSWLQQQNLADNKGTSTNSFYYDYNLILCMAKAASFKGLVGTGSFMIESFQALEILIKIFGGEQQYITIT